MIFIEIIALVFRMGLKNNCIVFERSYGFNWYEGCTKYFNWVIFFDEDNF